MAEETQSKIDKLGRQPDPDPPPYIASEEQVFLAAVLEQVEDAIVACNSDGVLTLFNRAAREIHGLPELPIPFEEWAEYYDLYLPDGKTRMSTQEVPLFRGLQGEHVNDVTLVIAPKDGPARTLLASARPLFDPTGKKLGAIAVMHDITERRMAEDTLRRESALMEALMDNIPDAIYFKDTESRFTRVNRHAPYRGNNTPADVVGKSDFDFFIEEHAHAAYEDEQRIMRTGQPVIDKVEQETYPDGSVTWLSTTKVPILDETGKVTGLVGISRDITERKRAEEERFQLVREQAAREEAEAANRFKDEFLAVVSHELRTPLTPIIGWSKMLLNSQCEGDLLVKALQAIERCAMAQLSLIDDLLDVSRIITGKLRFDVVSFDLVPIIKASVATLQPTAEAKSVKMSMADVAGSHTVTGDPERLRQIVLNLLSNAIKFTPEGGRVEVRLERNNSHTEISVSDTGVGIPPEFLPHVFERFRQADSSTSRNHGGLGLGLSIVRHLAELHGGSVRADSPGEGQGATFTVSLPSTVAGDSTGTAESLPGAGQGINGGENYPLQDLRILVVDDDVDTLEMLAAVLRRSGALVTVATSAEEAIEAIKSLPPDVFITDIGLPAMDGYDLLREVRRLPTERGGGVPAVALTAYVGAQDRHRALHAGFQIHIPKPVDLIEFVTTIANLGERIL